MPVMRRAFVIALALATALAANACRRIVDLTPLDLPVDAAAGSHPLDASHGSDATTDLDGGVPVGSDGGSFDPDGGVVDFDAAVPDAI